MVCIFVNFVLVVFPVGCAANKHVDFANWVNAAIHADAWIVFVEKSCLERLDDDRFCKRSSKLTCCLTSRWRAMACCS